MLLFALTAFWASTGYLAPSSDGRGSFPTMDAPEGRQYVINGGSQPEAIPEHAVWRTSLLAIAHARRHNTPHLKRINDTLVLSERDYGRLYREAEAEERRDADCRNRIRAWMESVMAERRLATLQALFALRGPDADALHERQMEMVIECRRLDLDAVEELLADLSSDGQAVLGEWINGRRLHQTLYVPVQDIGYYNLPR